MSEFIQIFLCDDDPDEALFFESALQAIHLGYTLTSFDESSEFLHFLFNGHVFPDIIILDLSMPKQNGLECLQEIRKKPSLANVPVIINSTSALSKDVDSAFRCGASLFMMKTCSLKDLQQKLQQILIMDKSRLISPSRENFFIALHAQG
jgi:CheY-like chemotaxis protein